MENDGLRNSGRAEKRQKQELLKKDFDDGLLGCVCFVCGYARAKNSVLSADRKKEDKAITKQCCVLWCGGGNEQHPQSKAKVG